MSDLSAAADSSVDPLDVVDRFNAAFNRQDLDAAMAFMTDECLFEDTTPPDGIRHEGTAAVRDAWARLFAAAPQAQFAAEESIALGDHVVVCWRYDWGEAGPQTAGHVRGIDVFRVTPDGLVAEKRSYVKG